MMTFVPLREVAEINPTSAITHLRSTDTVDFFPMSVVDAENTIARTSESRALEQVSKGFTCFQDGDILLAKITPCFENGKIAQAAVTTGAAFGSTEFHVIRCSAKLDARYLVHFLRRAEVRADGKRKMTGSAGQRRVPRYFLESLELPLPPLAEQRRAAAALDKADAMRTKRREVLAGLDRLAHSIFVDMFGDPGSNPRAWPLVPMGELLKGKPNNGVFRKNEDYGQGVPVVWVEELFRGQSIDVAQSRKLPATSEEVRKYGLKTGDILFCRSSLKLAGLGFNNIYLGADDDAIFECHLIRVSPNPQKVQPEFLNFLLRIPSQRQRLFRFAKTVTMSTIDQEGLVSIEVPLPPLDLQKRFVDRLHVVESTRAQLLFTNSALKELFDALQHRAFGDAR